MATILDFPEMQAPPRRRKVARGRPSAEVVIFPGVRYERRLDETSDKGKRPKIERDRLQLIE